MHEKPNHQKGSLTHLLDLFINFCFCFITVLLYSFNSRWTFDCYFVFFFLIFFFLHIVYSIRIVRHFINIVCIGLCKRYTCIFQSSQFFLSGFLCGVNFSQMPIDRFDWFKSITAYSFFVGARMFGSIFQTVKMNFEPVFSLLKICYKYGNIFECIMIMCRHILNYSEFL